MRCPQCNKEQTELSPRCGSCQADLALLVDYVSHLQGGLERADNLTRAGELGQSVWAYLEVLEVDPDNATARRQVGQVATAVRQFDQTAPGRRWLGRMRGEGDGWRNYAMVALLAIGIGVIAFSVGYGVGGWTPTEEEPTITMPEGPRDSATGK